MVPVKTMRDYDLLQDVTVLFNETVQRYDVIMMYMYICLGNLLDLNRFIASFSRGCLFVLHVMFIMLLTKAEILVLERVQLFLYIL